jgi:hypothetical protein
MIVLRCQRGTAWFTLVFVMVSTGVAYVPCITTHYEWEP